MCDLRLDGLQGAGAGRGIEERQREPVPLRTETGQTDQQVNQVPGDEMGGGDEVRESGNPGGKGLVDAGYMSGKTRSLRDKATSR